MRSLWTALALAGLVGCASSQEYDTRGIVRDHASTVDKGGVGNYLFPADYLDKDKMALQKPSEEDEVWETASSPTWDSSAELSGDEIEISDEIRFEPGSTKLTGDAERILDDVAAVILNNEESLGQIEIAGHTDASGSAKRNLELSEKRAEAVKDYLVARGVNPDLLVPAGYGESEPISDETALNRRVEFRTEFLAE